MLSRRRSRLLPAVLLAAALLVAGISVARSHDTGTSRGRVAVPPSVQPAPQQGVLINGNLPTRSGVTH
jgi:uncharacterized membrane protein